MEQHLFGVVIGSLLTIAATSLQAWLSRKFDREKSREERRAAQTLERIRFQKEQLMLLQSAVERYSHIVNKRYSEAIAYENRQKLWLSTYPSELLSEQELARIEVMRYSVRISHQEVRDDVEKLMLAGTDTTITKDNSEGYQKTIEASRLAGDVIRAVGKAIRDGDAVERTL